MRSTTKIKLDLSRQNYDARVEALQDDGLTRLVEATLLDGGVPWTVPEQTTVAVAYQKPDGTRGLYDQLPDGTPALTVRGGVVTAVLTRQMLSVPGTVRSSIVFQDPALEQLTAFPFTLEVTANPAVGALASVDYVRLAWLEEQLELLKTSGVFDGADGQTPQLLEDSVAYQVSDSGETVPTGTWLDAVPALPKGRWLWTRRTKRWSGAEAATDYSVSYAGLDGTGDVTAVAGVAPDESGNVPLTAGDLGAAATADVQAAAPWNLLDNSDFTNPVNQRGQTVYTAAGYCLDRWIANSVRPVTVGEDGVTLDGTDGVLILRQRIERLEDGVYTIAVKANGHVHVRQYRKEGSAYTLLYQNEAYSGGYPSFITVGDHPEVQLRANAGSVVTAQWIALYPGAYTEATLPLYRPKGFAAELAECMRYYQVCSTDTVAAVDMRPTMRLSSPAVSAVTGGYAYSAEL